MKVVQISKPTEAEYNSCDHKDPDYPPKPSTKPVHFGRWLPFLRSSSDYRVIELKAHETRLLKGINASAMLTGTLSPSQLDDFNDFGIAQRIQLAIPELGSPVFARFDECSPKDGLHRMNPLRDTKMVLEQISTAPRTASAIEKMEVVTSVAGEPLRCPLYLLKWDTSMDGKREFRCFCNGSKLTGISQYEWHSFYHDWTGAAESIWRCAEVVLERILEFNEAVGDGCEEALRRDGFVFDILAKEVGAPADEVAVEDVKVVEPNSFGSNSNCGSGLFHWVRDWEVLSGVAEPEFRICAKSDGV